MKISVIVPIYNTEKYLLECIESILTQTLQDFELILINDGSPDNSDAICKNYVQKDKRVIYLYQKNKGVSAARNKGIKQAHGEYLFFMDSDDTIDKNFLKNSYNTAQTNSSDIVVLGKAFLNRMPHPAALPICAMLLKRSFLLQYPDIIFPEEIQPCEDGLFSHMLLAMTNKISFEKDALYNYRHHEQQNHLQINKECEKVLKQIPMWFGILDDFYTKHNLYETKSLHLARFIEHEPWKLRFCNMNFSEIEKKQLLNIIQKFCRAKIPNILTNQKLIKSFSFSFQNVLKLQNFNVCVESLKKYKAKKFFLIPLVRLIPIKKYRYKLRNYILYKY